MLPWIVLAQIEVAHRWRTGEWLALTARAVLARGRYLLLDWVLGMIPIATTLAVTFGAIAWYFSRRYQARRAIAAPAPIEPL